MADWASLFPIIIASFCSISFINSHLSEYQNSTQYGPVSLMILAGATALFLQLGVNYSNDYFDNQRGLISKKRPYLAVNAAKRRMLFCITMGGISGLFLVGLSQLNWTEKGIFLLIGAICIAATYFYSYYSEKSGNKFNYADRGVADFASGFFFGPVGCCGAFYIITASGDFRAWDSWLSILMKSLSIGIVISGQLMLDNIRDIEADAAVDKRTVQVRIGYKNSVVYYIVSIIIAILIAIFFAHFYVVTLAILLFTFIVVVYQIVNLRENDLMKAFKFNALIALCLTLVMIF